jgi:outer membrane lipoprotein-sorting protein
MKPVLVCLVLLASSAAAAADPAGDAVLASVDAAVNRAKSHRFVYEAVTQEPGRGEKKLGLNVWMRGDRRLTEFTAPADLKGTKVLIMSPTEMYAYLPAFGKVRRIASHTTDQSAFGMAFSQDDLANQTYGDEYTATVAADAEKETRIVLVPKAGQKPAYGKIEMTVQKDTKVPSELKYYGASGNLIKTETRTGYTCESEVCVPGELKMVDHQKGGMWTRITTKTWKLNEAFADDLLSKRNLDK